MQLVKIGDLWINLDQVILIDDEGAQIVLSFVGAIAGEEPYALAITEAADVQALRAWLTQPTNAAHVQLQSLPLPPAAIAAGGVPSTITEGTSP